LWRRRGWEGRGKGKGRGGDVEALEGPGKWSAPGPALALGGPGFVNDIFVIYFPMFNEALLQVACAYNF